MQNALPTIKRPSSEQRAVIYEVNLSIDVEIIEQFDEWLHKHIEEMLAVPGFVSAATSVPDVEDENRKHRCVQYRLSDQAALDHYLEHYAETMRAKSSQNFEGRVSIERRILSVAEAALAKHGVCANCQAELLGRYCNVCGQREEPRVPTIASVVSEVTNELFGIESKLWRSIRLLLFKPGLLTKVFLSGQRQKYMSPIRLYLLFSLATFASFTFLNHYGVVDIGFDADQANAEQIAEANKGIEEAASAIDEMTFTSGFFTEEVDAEITRTIQNTVKSIQSDIEAGNKQAVIDKFFEPLPTALFVFLPIVALMLKLLYLGSGRYYVEHLIYVLHNHAFLFAVIIFNTISSQVVLFWPQSDIVLALVGLLCLLVYFYSRLRNIFIEKYAKSTIKRLIVVLVSLAILALVFSSTLSEGTEFLLSLIWSLYVPYYVYRSMLVVYERPGWVTAASLLLISAMYFFLLMFMLLSSAAFVGYNY